jgi:PHP family Zn ribbon phosphoesterase
MKRFNVVESEIQVGRCSKCGKSIKLGSARVRVVKVIDIKENREEWRCNSCVRGLSSQIAHKLTELELNELKSQGLI